MTARQRLGARLQRLSPDLVATLRRFPLAVLLLAGLTLGLLVLVQNGQSAFDAASLRRGIGGAGAGALFAAAGVLFMESRPERLVLGLVLAFLVPLLAILAFQLPATDVVVPYLLPWVGLLWLSVAAFTRIGAGEEQQNRFWWFNHHAFTSGVLAIAAFVLVLLGALAINFALDTLFGIHIDRLAQDLMALAGGLLAPLYWLSTLPHLEDYDEASLTQPQFLSRAIGFLGQFILVPILLAYALILLAYTVQIVSLHRLPQGRLGWMVLAFVTTGAATWLLVYPPFMGARLVVRFFRRWWFGLTLIPLALLALAVGVRIAAYGWTSERLLLAAGGLWAGLLALVFLVRRGDIRLIPALAGLILLALSLGPWNLEHGPRAAQAGRFAAALDAAGAAGATLRWTDATSQQARGASAYLLADASGMAMLQAVLAARGFHYPLLLGDDAHLLAELGIPPTGAEAAAGRSLRLVRPAGTVTDVAATPFLLGPVSTNAVPESGQRLYLQPLGTTLQLSDAAGNRMTLDLAAWLATQPEAGSGAAASLTDPNLDFALAGMRYRLAVTSVQVLLPPPGGSGGRRLVYLGGDLFASTAPATSTP